MELSQWDEQEWATLIYAIRRGNCILMLGPDAATESVEGQLRSLTEIFAGELAAELPSPPILPGNLAHVAQDYLMETGHLDLEVKVDAFYGRRQVQTSELHRNLAALPF